MRRGPGQPSFERFYYTRVGLGEGCGCAERVIDHHEIERLRQTRLLRGPRRGLLRRIWGVLRGRRND